MLQENKNPLYTLWEYMETYQISASEEEKQALSALAERSESLQKTLSEEQLMLYNHYLDSDSELNYVCQRQAFVKGVKFATSYLLSATSGQE